MLKHPMTHLEEAELTTSMHGVRVYQRNLLGLLSKHSGCVGKEREL